MGLFILAALIGVPLIEIGLFIEIGDAIGLWPTIFSVILTAMAGAALLRRQGLDALNRVQTSLNAGITPLGPVFDGFCLLAAGALLLTPGFFTDAIGFLLFIPPLRRLLLIYVARHIHLRTAHHPQRPPNPHKPGDIIDGDWQDVTPHKPKKIE